MGVEYDLSMSSSIVIEEVVKKVAQFEGHSLEEVNLRNGTYSFGNKFFSIFFSELDNELKEIQKEEYDIDCNVAINFRLITTQDPDATKEMVRVVDELLRTTEGDLVLEFNGDYPVIIRTNGKVAINMDYDDGSNFPFSELSMHTDVIRK